MNHATSIARAAIRNTTRAVLVIAAATPPGSVFGQNMERSFTVADGDSVVLDVERAHISVNSWNRNEVLLVTEMAHDFVFELNHQDGVVTIDGRHKSSEETDGIIIIAPDDAVIIVNGRRVPPDSPLRRRLSTVLAEITINVPYQQNLILRTSEGDIWIDRLQGEFTANTSSGNIEACEINGSVQMQTSSGSIRLQQASGPVFARASSGSIHLFSVAGPIQARSSSGDIRVGEPGATVEARATSGSIGVTGASAALRALTTSGSIEVNFTEQPESDSELHATSGTITVHLRDDFRANIQANTSSGRISSDFPDLGPRNSTESENLAKVLNGGGPRLDLQTTSGSIRIRHAEE